MINILTVSLKDLDAVKNESIKIYGKKPIFIISQETRKLIVQDYPEEVFQGQKYSTLCDCNYAIADWLSLGKVLVAYEI